MALTISNATGGGGGGGGGRGRILYNNPTNTHFLHHPRTFLPLSPRTLHIVSAKKLSSRTGRFDSKNRRSAITTTEQEDQQQQQQRTTEIEDYSKFENGSVTVDDASYILPELPGLKEDFWEGPKWEPLGFFVQYMWAFGIVFAVIACGIAVATYNEGATDFKATPVYKEAIGSQELLEEPESSNSDVFESNPTEVAPSLE